MKKTVFLKGVLQGTQTSTYRREGGEKRAGKSAPLFTVARQTPYDATAVMAERTPFPPKQNQQKILTTNFAAIGKERKEDL